MAMPVMQSNLQPTLQGELLELRPLERDDFPQLYKAAGDPLIWEQHPESDRYKRDVFQRFFDGAIESKGAFAIIERKTRTVIGSSRFYGYNVEQREVFIGYTFLQMTQNTFLAVVILGASTVLYPHYATVVRSW